MKRVHIMGASGSGTTTLGQSLAEALRILHFDSDSYYWRPTNPPFTEKTDVAERQQRLLIDLKPYSEWVLTGSMISWSEPFEPMFDLVVFLYLPPEIRAERLRQREFLRYGARISPGGDMHKSHLEFMEWALQYDEGKLGGRSKALHEKWMARQQCPVLRLEGPLTLAESLDQVLQASPLSSGLSASDKSSNRS